MWWGVEGEVTKEEGRGKKETSLVELGRFDR